jgi:hypothetical protein
MNKPKNTKNSKGRDEQINKQQKKQTQKRTPILLLLFKQKFCLIFTRWLGRFASFSCLSAPAA